MKFGKEIRRHAETHPRYRNFYLAYKELKGLIKRDERTKLRELLRQQLLKISGYAELQSETIGGEIRYILQKRNPLPLDVTRDRLQTLVEDYMELFEFWNVNQEGFRKICKKIDKKCQDRCSKWFLPMVETCEFRCKDWDLSLLLLGQVHGLVVAPELLEGSLRDEVILIPAQDVMKAKVILGTVCLGPPDPRPETSDALHRNPSRSLFTEIRKVKPITHLVWLDSPELSQFLQRYRRRNCELFLEDTPAVSEFRFRWVEGAAEDVFLDIVYRNREQHSVRMRHSEVADLCAQKPAGRAERAVEEIRHLINDNGLLPVVSCSFRRTTFGLVKHSMQDDSAPLAVLDEDIVFIDEWREKRTKQWCRMLEEAESPTQEGRHTLGWALLRLKRGAPAGAAQKLRELGMSQAHFFSKALCGTLIFQQAALLRLPIPVDFSLQTVFRLSTAGFPLPENEIIEESIDEPGRSSPASPATEAEPAWAAEKMAAWCRYFRSLNTSDGRNGEDLLLVDCKTPTSNERTVLRWFRSAVMMLSVSAFLTSNDGFANQINGLLLGAVALLCVFWPLSLFHQRSAMIQKPRGLGQPATDRAMPQALGFALASILTSVLVHEVPACTGRC